MKARTAFVFASSLSTDAAGVQTALGIKVDPRVELEVMVAAIDSKLSERTLLTF